MKPDRDTSEQMATQQKRAAAFYGAQYLVFALFIAGIGCWWVFSPSLKHNLLGFNIGFVIWPVLQMLWSCSKGIATQLCRFLDLSLDATTTETLFRNDEFVADSTTSSQTFVLNRGCSNVVPLGATMLSLIFGISIFFRPHPYLFHHPSNFLSVALCIATLTATAILSWKNLRKPELAADHHGVTTCSALGVTSRQISWSQIASFSIVTKRDVFGKILHKSVQLNDNQQRKLLIIQLTSGTAEARRENIDRFINALSARLTGEAYYPAVPSKPFEPPPPPPIRPRREISDVPLEVKFEPDFVEVKVAGYFQLLASVAMMVASAIFLRWNAHTESLWERVIVEGVPILFCFATLITIPMLYFTAVQLRADAHGLSQRSGFFAVLKLTRWQDVATVELVKKRDEVGCLIAQHLVLKDRNENVITQANVTDLNREQNARLLAFVQDKIDSQHWQ